MTLPFYDELADSYHLIFEDWDQAIERQASILGPLLQANIRNVPLEILDCACGIGTQSLGLAAIGHRVTASDISPAAVNRARKEAQTRSLDVTFRVSDMTSLAGIEDRHFDAVVAIDNALPHLSATQLTHAIQAIASKLKPNGLFVASIRDYDQLIRERLTMLPPAFYGQPESKRIVHQVWDWLDDANYQLHLYITQQAGSAWKTYHFISAYRCLLRAELCKVLTENGFDEIRWLMPLESGFYQPLLLATAPAKVR